MIIGLTGGTGTGKTSVSEHFAAAGFKVIDYDKVTREIYKKGSCCLNEVVAAFGQDILTPDGELCRKKLGEIVFANKEKLELLNSIVYKYILNHTAAQIEENKNGKLLLDAPTLFEAGLNKKCDYVVGVIAKKELRLERICKRDNLSPKLACDRIDSQKDDSFYKENCDFIIENSGKKEDLKEKVLNILGRIDI